MFPVRELCQLIMSYPMERFATIEIKNMGPTNPTPELPWWLNGLKKKNLPANRRHGFSSWVRQIPWRRKWQPTAVFLPGETHGQRSLVGYNKESDMTEAT